MISLNLRSLALILVCSYFGRVSAQATTEIALLPIASKSVRVQWAPRWNSPGLSRGNFSADAMTTDANGNLFVNRARYEVVGSGGLLMFYDLDESAAKFVCDQYSVKNHIVPALVLKAIPTRRSKGANIVHYVSDRPITFHLDYIPESTQVVRDFVCAH